MNLVLYFDRKIPFTIIYNIQWKFTMDKDMFLDLHAGVTETIEAGLIEIML